MACTDRREQLDAVHHQLAAACARLADAGGAADAAWWRKARLALKLAELAAEEAALERRPDGQQGEEGHGRHRH